MILLTFNLALPSYKADPSKKIGSNQLISSIEENTDSILSVLDKHGFLATFFVEISLIPNLEKQLKKVVSGGHEVALFNINSDVELVEKTKLNVEQILQKPIRGIRQKYHQLTYEEIKKSGFNYLSEIEESSINFLWRKLTTKTEIHIKNELTIIPESQSPYSQLPFNDYVLQVTPMKYYESMILESLKNNEYVMIYSNIWQFLNKENLPFELPFYKTINIGKRFEQRIEKLLQYLDENETAVSRMKDYLF